MEAGLAEEQTAVVRPKRQRIRAISTTIGVVLAGTVLEFVIGFLAVTLSLSTLNNNEVINVQIYGIVSFLVILLIPVAPAALGGMYWLALRGLQRRRVRGVWLEVVGLGTALFLVTGVLTSIVDIEAGRIIFANNAYNLDQRLSTALQEIAQYPYLMLIMLVLAMFFAIVIVNIARFFTNWRRTDAPAEPQRIWRDVGSIWALTTFISLACSIGQLLINNYFSSIDGPTTEDFPIFIILILLIYFFIPTGIVAAIACADTLRSLDVAPAATVKAAPNDPFASSDGSFTLSISPINERE